MHGITPNLVPYIGDKKKSLRLTQTSENDRNN